MSRTQRSRSLLRIGCAQSAAHPMIFAKSSRSLFVSIAGSRLARCLCKALSSVLLLTRGQRVGCKRKACRAPTPCALQNRRAFSSCISNEPGGVDFGAFLAISCRAPTNGVGPSSSVDEDWPGRGVFVTGTATNGVGPSSSVDHDWPGRDVFVTGIAAFARFHGRRCALQNAISSSELERESDIDCSRLICQRRPNLSTASPNWSIGLPIWSHSGQKRQVNAFLVVTPPKFVEWHPNLSNIIQIRLRVV